MARPPKITERYLNNHLEEGHGTGFDENYLPMIEVKRWNPSPVSIQVRKPLPPFRRVCHFLSQSEWFIALLMAWVGAWVREQYPLWSWPHPHPEYGRNDEHDADLPRSSGMLAICDSAKIRHGTFVGTNIPYVWTIDLCLTLPWIDTPKWRTVLVSIKPLLSDRYRQIDPLDRGPEKLEGERRYALDLGVSYLVEDASLYPGPLFAQLETLAEAAILPVQHPLYVTLQAFLQARCHNLQQEELSETLQRLKKDWKLPLQSASFLLDHMLWHQMIDCDLSRPIRRQRPPTPGGRSLIKVIRSELSGDYR